MLLEVQYVTINKTTHMEDDFKSHLYICITLQGWACSNKSRKTGQKTVFGFWKGRVLKSVKEAKDTYI